MGPMAQVLCTDTWHWSREAPTPRTTKGEKGAPWHDDDGARRRNDDGAQLHDDANGPGEMARG